MAVVAAARKAGEKMRARVDPCLDGIAVGRCDAHALEQVSVFAALAQVSHGGGVLRCGEEPTVTCQVGIGGSLAARRRGGVKHGDQAFFVPHPGFLAVETCAALVHARVRLRDETAAMGIAVAVPGTVKAAFGKRGLHAGFRRPGSSARHHWLRAWRQKGRVDRWEGWRRRRRWQVPATTAWQAAIRVRGDVRHDRAWVAFR